MKIDVDIRKYSHQNGKEEFFSNIKFAIEENGFYLITGTSGVGKSTLIKILLDIHEGQLEGEIKYSHQNKLKSAFNLRELGLVGYQADDLTLIPWKNILDNILLPSEINDNLEGVKKDNILLELEELGLSEEILYQYPHQLSFGQKARAGLIRTFIYQPQLVFLDEFFSGLDYFNQTRLCTYLKKYSSNCLILAISHQIESAKDITKEIFHMRRKALKCKIYNYKREKFSDIYNNLN